MKLVFLVVLCVFGRVLCETHEQQKNYGDVLIEQITEAADGFNDLLKNSNENTERGKNLIMLFANTLNFELHYILDCLQFIVSTNDQQYVALQQIALRLNSISYVLEKSFKSNIRVLKFQLRTSVMSLVWEAVKLRKIIRENENHVYRSTVLQFLDDLTNAVEKVMLRATIRVMPFKMIWKSASRHTSKTLVEALSVLNSEDVNVHDDIYRYSSKFSSAISETTNILKDLAFTYKVEKEDEIKQIVYSLGKLVHENEEVLFNESSFIKIKTQFIRAIVSLNEELDKIVNAGFSDNGISVKDDNLIYVVFIDVIATLLKLSRNLERTYENYIDSGFD